MLPGTSKIVRAGDDHTKSKNHRSYNQSHRCQQQLRQSLHNVSPGIAAYLSSLQGNLIIPEWFKEHILIIVYHLNFVKGLG